MKSFHFSSSIISMIIFTVYVSHGPEALPERAIMIIHGNFNWTLFCHMSIYLWGKCIFLCKCHTTLKNVYKILNLFFDIQTGLKVLAKSYKV